MKKILYIMALAVSSTALLSSCEDFLNPESKTNITIDYLTNSPDSLNRAAIGLCVLDRKITRGTDNGGNDNLYVISMCGCITDLVTLRAGASIVIAKLENFVPNNGDVEALWQQHYFIIGKTNGVIAGAGALGVEDPDPLIRRAYRETESFRERTHFGLWKCFEHLYLNTESTTVSNLGRNSTPTSKEDIFIMIRGDLDTAIEMLDRKAQDGDYGRITKTVARHMRIQVIMWDKDYDKAIEECEDIFEGGTYSTENKIGDMFSGLDFRLEKVLWTYQFSTNLGDGGSDTPLMGHCAAIITTTRYQPNANCTFGVKSSGYGWGRVYPNTYSFSLYDQAKDNRYKGLFIHTFYYNGPKPVKFGQEIPKNLYGTSIGYMEKPHPMSKKHFDQWTNVDQPNRTISFRDLIVYRLAEAYLMCAEACFHRNRGSSSKTIECYNETWERAGNDHEDSPLTLDILLDGYARELRFEGMRWPLLKRLGILGERVRPHDGNLKSEDLYLGKDYAECHRNFVDGKHETWPIPQNQVGLMGVDVFSQSDPWKQFMAYFIYKSKKRDCNTKRLIWVSSLLCLVLVSYKEYNEVRIMPEFNNSETEVILYENIDSQATVVINTTADDATAEYDVGWSSVDVNKRHVTYTTTAINETGEPHTAVVKLASGEWMQEITVTQRELEGSEIKLLKVGDLAEDGLGMIFWVDPGNPRVGRAVSLQRRVGACESPYKMNGAFSTVNGIENTVPFASPSLNDTVVFCTSIGDGWYMSISEEFAGLSDIYNGIARGDPAFVANNTGAITDIEKTAHAKFEKMLVDLSGGPVNSAVARADKSYWSSTEVSTVVDEKNAIYVRFGEYLLQGSSEEGPTRYIRAMKSVDDHKFPEEPATLKVSPSRTDLTSEEGTPKEMTVTTNKDTYTYIAGGEDVVRIKAEQDGDIVTFTALSVNTSDKERSVTVAFATGSENNQAMAEITVTQEKMSITSTFTTGEYVDMDKGVQLAGDDIVFWAKGNETRILALKRIELVGWLPSDADAAPASIALGLDGDNGGKNTQEVRECSFSDRISVLQYRQDGRYLPAANEMDEVFKAYNGGVEIGNTVATPEEQATRANWEQILVTRSGDAMNIKEGVGDEYMTSSESVDVTKIFFVRFDKWESEKPGVKIMKKPTRYIRLICKVSK